jgi:uncharacterized membrane protein YccC
MAGLPSFNRSIGGIAVTWVTWPRVRQAIQTTVAAVAAYLVATYFALPQGYWSVMTAILVVQASVGGSLGLAIDRLLATVLGAAIGGVLVAVFGEARLPLLTVSVLTLTFLATLRGSLRLAPVTAAVVILGDPHFGSPLASALNRVIEIGIGALIAMLTSLLLFPSRAGAALAEHVGRTLPLFAGHLVDTIDAALGKERAEDDILRLNAKVRAALTAGESLVAEARRERAGRIADHADPAAVMRTMRRLWYTLAMAARAARSPLPAEAAITLASSLREVSDAAGDAIGKLGTAYTGETPRPDMARVQSALQSFDAAMADLRRSGALRPMGTDDAARIFAFAFALGQLSQNLKDLGDRYGDLVGIDGTSGASADAERDPG